MDAIEKIKTESDKLIAKYTLKLKTINICRIKGIYIRGRKT